MQSGIYVGLSGQIALQTRLDTVANNVANASTAGYRAEEVTFESELSRIPPNPVAFTAANETYLSRESGPVTRTDNPLDVAVRGDAWLSVDQGGQQVYTRDGRMQMGPNGDLQNLNGDAVLDVGGAPIILNPNGGAPEISPDGAIFQNGQRIGALGLFRIDENARLTRAGNAAVVPDQPAIPALDFAVVGVRQGYVEGSNVNPVMEMTRLIDIHRRFDAMTRSLDSADQTLERAIREIGPSR